MTQLYSFVDNKKIDKQERARNKDSYKKKCKVIV